MYSSKLVSLLRGLNKDEQRKYEAYVRALYPNRTLALQLMDEVLVCGPAFDDKEALEAVAKSMTAQNGSTKKNVDNSASELYGYLQDFLLMDKLREKGNPLRERMLCDIYNERQLTKLWVQKTDALLKHYADTPPADQWDVLEALYAQHQRYFSPMERKEKSGPAGQAQLQALMDKLELFSQVAKLQYGIELLNRQNVLHETNDIEGWAALKASAAQRNPQDELLQALLLAAQLMEAPSDEHYRQLRDFFMAHYTALSARMHPVIQSYINNYISQQLRDSRIEFLADAFEQSKFEVEMLLSFTRGSASLMRYINIINAACSAKEIDWAERFIASYSKYLHETFREPAKKLAAALILYEKGKYADVLQAITGLEKTIPRMETFIKAIDIFCCLHLGIDKDYIKGKCDNFLAYLKQHTEIGEDTKTAFRNFVRLASAYNTNPDRAPKLIEEVNNTTSIYFKEWLLILFNKKGQA